MATRQTLEREIKRDIAAQGYSIQMLNTWPNKATYYKSDGEVMLNLPSDPWSMKKYLARGFTLEPPRPKEIVGVIDTELVLRPTVEVAETEFRCEEPRCRFVGASERSLKTHSRKHRKEDNQ